MNLTDLRDELAVRAAETDDRHDDLLPGVRRKITTTKRRRATGVLAGVVAIAAVALGIVPGLTGAADSADPIKNPTVELPADSTQNGITYPGIAEGDLLQQAFVSKPGESSARFTWTPTSKALTIRPMCAAPPERQRSVKVVIDGLTIARQPCTSLPGDSVTLPTTDTLWLRAEVGKPAEVTLQLTDDADRAATDPLAQVGVGLYTTGPRATLNAPPSKPHEPGAGDYEKDGIRYRGTVGGDVLEEAVVGERGQTTVTTTYFPSTADLVFRSLCLAEETYNATLTIDGNAITSIGCGAGGSTDAGASGGVAPEPGRVWPFIRIGARHTVTLRLEDQQGRPVRSDQARLAFGIYQQGPIELSDWRTAPATSKEVMIVTPAGKPHLLSYGYGGTAENLRFVLTQKGEADAIDGPAAGIGTVGRTARAADVATLRIEHGKPTEGTLILAVYTPVP